MKLILLLFFATFFFRCTESITDKGYKNLSLGDYHRAVQLFSKVIDNNPENYTARLGLGKALLQQLAGSAQNEEIWNVCLINLEAARTINSDSSIKNVLSAAWHQRAVYLLFNKDSTRALQSLLKSIQYDKTNAKPLNLAGILYFNQGDFQKAYSLFTLVINLDTLSPTGYFNAGMVSWSSGNCLNSKQLWLNALRKYPDNKDLLYWAATAEKSCAGQQ
jgi:tetratricopeptide (TPR) repeat protein